MPPRGLLPSAVSRSRPHIYNDAEIEAVITAARALTSIYGVRGLTYSTLFELISVTGLRVSEALAFDRDDLNIDLGVLRVRWGKLGKEPLLSLHPSVVTELLAYCAERDRLVGHLMLTLFVTEKGTRLADCGARYNFAHASQ